MENTLPSTSMERFRPKLAAKAKGSSKNINGYRLPSKPSKSFKPRIILKCVFFVFSFNFARAREGKPARRKLTELLVKSKKILVTILPPSVLFFKSRFHVRLRLLSFTSSMLHIVWSRKRNDKTLTPTLTGFFFVDRF